MKLASTIISLAAFFSVASADNVRFNTFYDNPQASLNNVACSNGNNGLVTKGFPTFGSLPSFPGIGAAKALTFGGNSIYITAIDTVGDGFDISLAAMNILTNGQAQKLDVVNAQATQVDNSFCGLPP
ncbi:immunomodulatory protein [Lactarius sanguifluus]|nr:immunomodulatory protein [Lactarius sanguifluus]